MARQCAEEERDEGRGSWPFWRSWPCSPWWELSPRRTSSKRTGAPGQAIRERTTRGLATTKDALAGSRAEAAGDLAKTRARKARVGALRRARRLRPARG